MIEALARLEIELAAERGRDRRRPARADRFLRGPEGLGLVRGLDQREARRVEAEGVKARAVGAPAAGELLQGEDEQQGAGLARHAPQQRQQEAEGGGQVGLGGGRDLMHGAEGEAALGQAAVERGEAERQAASAAARHALQAGEKPAQRVHGLGASREGGSGQRGSRQHAVALLQVAERWRRD